MSSPDPTPSIRIGDLTPYTPPPRDPRITLTLDNNEGSPIDPEALRVLESLDPETLSRYPDQSALEARIANVYGIDPNRVVVTNGGDDAIDRVCRATLDPSDTMITHSPGFVMIPRWAKLAGASTQTIEWFDTPFPAHLFIDSMDERTKLISLVSPNNPTGAVIPTSDIIAVTRAAQRRGVIVMIDQAYTEFADEDPSGVLFDEPNAVIVRTFSKALGAAGLRIGYAIAPEPIATNLRTVGGPYPVSTPSLLIAGELFARRDDRTIVIEQTRANRQTLSNALRELGCLTLDSQSNFVLARFENAQRTHASLLDQGISVRRFRTGTNLDNHLRITVPADTASLTQLLDALAATGSSA